jgi:hypothetical protein
MTKYIKNSFIEIFYEFDKMTLIVVWKQGTSYLSEIEYVNSWSSILEYIFILKPKHLLIESQQFEYRKLGRINIIFNHISKKLKSENITIVQSKSILGFETINDLIYNCPSKGHKIFNNSNEATVWIESQESYVSY